MTRTIAAGLAILTAAPAFAHVDGTAHAHAAEALLVLAAAVAFGVAVYWTKG